MKPSKSHARVTSKLQRISTSCDISTTRLILSAFSIQHRRGKLLHCDEPTSQVKAKVCFQSKDHFSLWHVTQAADSSILSFHRMLSTFWILDPNSWMQQILGSTLCIGNLKIFCVTLCPWQYSDTITPQVYVPLDSRNFSLTLCHLVLRGSQLSLSAFSTWTLLNDAHARWECVLHPTRLLFQTRSMFSPEPVAILNQCHQWHCMTSRTPCGMCEDGSMHVLLIDFGDGWWVEIPQALPVSRLPNCNHVHMYAFPLPRYPNGLSNHFNLCSVVFFLAPCYCSGLQQVCLEYIWLHVQ